MRSDKRIVIYWTRYEEPTKTTKFTILNKQHKEYRFNISKNFNESKHSTSLDKITINFK